MAKGKLWNKRVAGPKLVIFLEVFAKTGIVSSSCKEAGVSMKTAYEYYAHCPEFSAKWDEALKTAGETLENEAFRRAFHGVKRPVFQGGRQVGEVTEYSDSLMARLLEATNPAKYGRRMEHTGKNGGAIQFEKILDIIK